MRFLLLPGAAVSVGLVILGIIWLVQVFRRRTVGAGPLVPGLVPLSPLEAKSYSVFIHGGGSAKRPPGIPLSIRSAVGGGDPALRYPLMSFRTRKGGRMVFEYARFDAPVAGDYHLSIGALDQVVVYPTQLTLTRFLQRPAPLERLRFSVEESISVPKFVLSILFLVLGLNAAVWCILLFFRPDLIPS
jgi:hypothetical protein